MWQSLSMECRPVRGVAAAWSTRTPPAQHGRFVGDCALHALPLHIPHHRDPAVRVLLSKAIKTCIAKGKYVGICGQGPSDHPDFAEWLMQEGISSISLNPDSVIETWQKLAGK